MQEKLQTPKGMRDYLPKLWYTLDWLRSRWLSLALKWGYEPIETPVMEYLWVLERKAGPQVRDEIYWFKDKAGREIGLRFDMTVPLARIAASNPQIPKPIRWCYFSRVWRYDEPQHGRWREFWQFGVELMGSPHVEADSEVIALFTYSYAEVGVDVEVRLFDRRIMDSFLEKTGIKEDIRSKVLGLIDKRWKISEEEFKSGLAKLGLSDRSVDEIVEFTSIKKPLKNSIDIISDITPNLREFYEELVELLESYGVLDKVFLDTSIVRGLEYYTGLVFEAYPQITGRVDEKWNRLAIGGGGRYDELVGLYRKPGVPATGFAIGVDRVILFLEENNLLPEHVNPRLDVFIAIRNREHYKYAVDVARILREMGLRVEVDVMRRNIKEALRYANKRNTRILVYIAPRELAEGKIVVRDLEEYKQYTIPINELAKTIKHILNR